MRVGFNPHKDKPLKKSEYFHQVIIPVYIPNQENYFKDSFKIFQLCLESLFLTIHNKTFVTIVNNGSCSIVKDYLDELYKSNKIHELIHTENIGKLNAILKGLAGSSIELVTISDADVLFLTGWQSETITIFNKMPKVGVVGIVPQFTLFKTNCGNILLENIFNKNLKFTPVEDPDSLVKFYDSIGWERTYNENYLKYNLTLEQDSDLKVLVGSGHFVATYKKDIFENIASFIGYKLGGDSETYLDRMPLFKDYWRVTTSGNYAYHMGNTIEDWMPKVFEKIEINPNDCLYTQTYHQASISKHKFFLKNKLFRKIFRIPFVYSIFLTWKKLPSEMKSNY